MYEITNSPTEDDTTAMHQLTDKTARRVVDMTMEDDIALDGKDATRRTKGVWRRKNVERGPKVSRNGVALYLAPESVSRIWQSMIRK